MEYIYLPPSECTIRQINEFERLVRRGSQVQLAGLRERIIDAFILGLVYNGSRLVSIGALKNPIANYHLDVFRKAGIPDQAANYPRETGWAFTDEGFRGQGIHRQVLSQLLVLSPTGVFATTKAKNVPEILVAVGFKAKGMPYINNGGETLRLFAYDKPAGE